MRAFCTVSAPLEVCAPPTRPLLPGSRFLALKLLGTPQPRTLYFLVEAKSRVREVYSQTCLHFAKQGMLDTELFGLAVLIDGEYLFADPESKLSKYGPKSWRSSHTHGLDANGRPLLEFHFRVQFYIESPLMLRDETSRHNYYLQLKSNTVNQEIPKECSEQSLILLGALALQADFGDCPNETNDDYFKLDDYVPSNLRTTWGATALYSCHKEYRGMSRADAETNYIKESCALNDAINAHIFKMKLTKNETGPGSIWFVVYAKGIKIFGENFQTANFLWPNISKLCFERKKFEIKYGEHKTILYSSSDIKNKKLFSLCKETHQFSMKIATRLNDAIRREEEECSSMHVCDMYSRALNLPYKNKGDQRISVISSTSSNTTSGIVSDRVHSEDELEIMINTPPAANIAAPSTESLALAHLLDKPSVSRQTSSVSRMSMKELDESIKRLSTRQIARSASNESTPEQPERKHDLSESDSPNSQHNIGSQCSSTCSTIVVATENSPQQVSSTTASRRRPSTSSSMELGFSHTAQNSAISESTTTSVDVAYGNNAIDEEDISGVYTLNNPAPTETSGVYTMSNSELTGQSSELAESESHESSYYGSFQPKSEINESTLNVDSVDGNFNQSRKESSANDFRMRSDSNVSSTSFRGDGSDPTDKKTLLSAEELTDLIVGRGSYPSRKTVSNTLDSDCDYVTMPLPLKEGESFLPGHEDTAPSDDTFDVDLLSSNPPPPPVRIDSNAHRVFSGMINKNRSMPPPPYSAHHKITPVATKVVEKHHDEVPAMHARDPPPYPQQSSRVLMNSTSNLSTNSSSVMSSQTSQPEEAAARFITTRPQINILKAHTSLVGENQLKPSYAAPTIPPPVIPQVPHSASQNLLATSIGIPVGPYNIGNVHKNHLSNISSPYPDVKTATQTPRACVLLPVIKPTRQYIPPPPTLPRQPPPPPPQPAQLATVYTSQLAQSQIELYQKQLYDSCDYVIYPLQDPAISQQEYLDAKQGSIIAAMAQNPAAIPPPYFIHTNHGTWDACKGHAIYRSTPYLSMAYSTHSHYASTQNLSDTYVQLPSGAYSPLYSPSIASLCSSYDAPPPIPLRPRPMATATMFSRSKSDDNILNSIETLPKAKRLPPPPPPYHKKSIKPPMPPPIEEQSVNIPTPMIQKSRLSTQPITTTLPRTNASMKFVTNEPIKSVTNSTSIPPSTAIDINILREHSKHFDLPLISALCNDRSLLKQTAFVMPKHPSSNFKQNTLQSSKGKYPVSGLSTTQLHKSRQKTSISHRHPNDKLPPLPTPSVMENNYVMDPAMKHKSFSSQPNLKQA
ncbi:protein expanded [Contarinia nasturtii]|uniref:protein expanded n=1 Tax=Contarinia nasturtii TaxID=265458 RepID=UPI0012D416A6|nr:protein expanded [Contarinia nasturtii]XP_031623167.1 protein expanded [Contarinia nasturtii]